MHKKEIEEIMRLLAAIFGAIGLLFAVLAYSRTKLPYNEEGRFLNAAEGVVYDTDAVVAYGFIAGVFVVLSLGAATLPGIFNRKAKS